jgi:hypothetical protein
MATDGVSLNSLPPDTQSEAPKANGQTTDDKERVILPGDGIQAFNDIIPTPDHALRGHFVAQQLLLALLKLGSLGVETPETIDSNGAHTAACPE